MITLRRNAERLYGVWEHVEMWRTFFTSEGSSPAVDDFGGLIALNEIRIPPGRDTVPYPSEEAEIVSFVHKGAIAKADSTGTSEIVHAGEFQHLTLGRGLRKREANASRSNPARIFQISLHPAGPRLGCTPERKRFATSQRHNSLCIIASPDGRRESLRVFQDVLIYSGIFDPGHHLIHELLPERSAWLHVIYGEATLQDLVLTEGDGVGVTNERAVSLTAQVNTEILLVDLATGPSALR